MGDTHIHSGTSKESTWTVDDIAAKAVHYGCDFIAFTNHYLPEVQSSLDQARVDYPSLIIFQGLEWRVPRGNRRIDPERSCHPEMTLFVTNHPDETQLINDFRNLFDGYSKPHEKAVEGLVWLENKILNGVKPVCIVNHPSKKGGSYTIDHLRDYDDAGTVCIGISGAPGHQKRIYEESFEGSDIMTAQIGHYTDQLLSEGRKWWVRACSDYHNVGGRDYWPVYHAENRVYCKEKTPEAIIEGYRAGCTYYTHGDIIEGLDLPFRRATSRS
jgi:hypothetical protein